jgi:hypothetical protein
MTAAAPHREPAPEVAKNTAAIRAVLLPEEHADFDAACDRAMSAALAQSNVTPLQELLDEWHPIARATLQNSAARRIAVRRMREFERTGTLVRQPGELRGTAAATIAALKFQDL